MARNRSLTFDQIIHVATLVKLLVKGFYWATLLLSNSLKVIFPAITQILGLSKIIVCHLWKFEADVILHCSGLFCVKSLFLCETPFLFIDN
jgi:hypothetical protein